MSSDWIPEERPHALHPRELRTEGTAPGRGHTNTGTITQYPPSVNGVLNKCQGESIYSGTIGWRGQHGALSNGQESDVPCGGVPCLFWTTRAISPSLRIPVWSVPSGTPLIEVVIIALYALICGAEGWEDMEAYGQIPPGPRGCGYAKAEVEVGQLLDGCRRIYQGEKLLGEYPPTEVVDPLRRPKRNPNAPGADDAQWIYLASAPPEEPKTVGRATRSPGRGIRASRVA